MVVQPVPAAAPSGWPWAAATLTPVSTCSTASRERGEPLAGTAATARSWLLVEQPGPWGAKALTASRLDPELGRALDRAASPHGVRVALIRRPGPHADPGPAAPRRVVVAHTVPGRSWVTVTETTDPEALADLDFAALGAGERAAAGPGAQPHRGGPLALVCTNGRRDRCCAVLGRPLAEELAGSAADVWETTHLGGHRFAPTMLVLPYGYAYGRIDAHAAQGVLAAAGSGQVLTEHCRGRSAWGPPGQAADLAVRELTGEREAEALSVREAVETGERRWTVRVAHTDGRGWQVRAEAGKAAEPTPASCGKTPKAQELLRVRDVRPLGAVHPPDGDPHRPVP